ncbi:hypothetical protein BH11GEM2_BH11GEM2_13140 [soil metagenome]
MRDIVAGTGETRVMGFDVDEPVADSASALAPQAGLGPGVK